MTLRCISLSLRHVIVAGLVGVLTLAPAAATLTPFNSSLSAEKAMSAGAEAMRRGQFAEAVSYWQLSSAAYEQGGDIARQLDSLLQLVDAQQNLGLVHNAHLTLIKAQPLAEQPSDPVRRAAIAGSWGKNLSLRGHTDEARRYLHDSVFLARQAQAWPIAAAGLNNLGNLAAELGDFQTASNAYQEGLRLAQTAPDPALAVTIQLNAANLAVRTHDSQSAARWLAQAAVLNETLPDGHDKVVHLLSAGQLRRKLSAHLAQSPNQALQDFATAATLARTLDDRRSLSYALGYQAQWQQDSGHTTQALTLFRQAVFTAQEVDAPELLYRWQWEIGRLLKKQSDRDGAILAYQQAVDNLQVIRQDFIADQNRNSDFRANVGDAFIELADLLLQRAEQRPSQAARESDLLAARSTMEALKTAEIRDYFRDDCALALQSRTVTLDRQSLPRTAILYPILFPNRLELLFDAPNGLQKITVQVAQNNFTKIVREFRQYLGKRTSREYLPSAQQLYDWLIRPLENELNNQKIDTLVIVPDGPLRTIPLSALHDGQNFLISRYAIATTPGLTLTDLRPIQRQNIRPLLNGLTKAVQGFPSLEYVQQELNAIHTVYGGKVLENEDFRLLDVQQALKETPYSIVHIASHGQFASDVSKTFILTFDDKLTMDRLERFMALSQYRDQPVELLTLSACQTAAGDDRAALGLAGVAVKAGARSAIATLWSVNDEATALLIGDFYQQLRDPTLSKAVALQRAQKMMLKDQRYQHPSYWSPYLLIGNWL